MRLINLNSCDLFDWLQNEVDSSNKLFCYLKCIFNWIGLFTLRLIYFELSTYIKSQSACIILKVSYLVQNVKSTWFNQMIFA